MTPPRNTPFGERLMEARREKGLGVRKLSELSGVDFRSIYHYEDHSRSPNIEAAAALALALDCSLDWLCALDETRNEMPIQRTGCKEEIQHIGCGEAA